jgi:nucleotide-binding universal stress UspA family protein/nitrite reductase/ring-hydroxylating ferredoxin subunit
MAYRKIVVGVDGSHCGDHARDVAARVAAVCGSTLFVAHVAEDRSNGALVDSSVAAAVEAGAKARGEELQGGAADALLDFTDRNGAELLVLGAWGLGRSQRHQIGSVPHRAAHHAESDVLIVAEHPPADPAETVFPTIAIATDGSPTADRACLRGFEFAEQIGAEVVLVFVGHPKTGELVLNDTVATVASQVPTRLRIEQGPPAARILEVADEEGARLLVVGNRGMSSARRFLLGSVPQQVIEGADRDVLIVRTVTQDLREIKKGEGGIVVVGGEKIAAYRDGKGKVHGVSAKCTHMGCTVGWNPAERSWDCPCHGSRYAPTGEVINGPASKPLPEVALED